MSVVVIGMEMPESCYYCGLADTSFINCMAFEKPILLEDDCEEKRPDWCPLVALPDKHGRLVDADELIKFVEDRYEITWESDCYEGGIKDACSDILEKIDTMPTIVEAEGEP